MEFNIQDEDYDCGKTDLLDHLLGFPDPLAFQESSRHDHSLQIQPSANVPVPLQIQNPLQIPRTFDFPINLVSADQPADAQKQDQSKLVRTRKEGDEKPFVCRFCYKRFSRSQALGGHMNRHRKEREDEQLEKARRLLRDTENESSRMGYFGQGFLANPEFRMNAGMDMRFQQQQMMYNQGSQAAQLYEASRNLSPIPVQRAISPSVPSYNSPVPHYTLQHPANPAQWDNIPCQHTRPSISPQNNVALNRNSPLMCRTPQAVPIAQNHLQQPMQYFAGSSSGAEMVNRNDNQQVQQSDEDSILFMNQNSMYRRESFMLDPRGPPPPFPSPPRGNY